MASQVTTGRFVGRTNELARLRELLARAADGQPLVAVIGGEAGVGKTRLAEELAATANEQGVRVLRGGSVPLGEEGVPFAPVVQALRGLASQLDPAELAAVAGPARAELARLLPDLAWGGPATTGAEATGASQAGQGQLFELLLRMLERLAARAPLVFIVEDLHWADRSTRDLLAYLATTLRSGRMLLVGSFRSDELDRRHPLRGCWPSWPATAAWSGWSCPALAVASWPSCWPACSATSHRSGCWTTFMPARRVTRSSPRSCCWPAATRVCCRPACSRCSSPGWCGWATARSSCCGWPPRPAQAPPSHCWPRSPA